MLELKEEEKRLVKDITLYLDSREQDEYRLVKHRFKCLEDLGNVISNYPSVRESNMLRGSLRDEQKLLKALCSFAQASHLLHIPSRVVLTRSYLVAKFQAFSLLSILVRDREEFAQSLRNIMYSIIHTLMIEEVYFSCLDDPGFAQDIKMRVADDLIALWDSGTDSRLVRHLPAFEDLWTARDNSPPAFGTMNGSSELLRITIDMGKDWQEFLMDQTTINETRWALEEFLFGLSYEEIAAIRTRLSKFGIAAVGHDEVRSFLDSRPSYDMVSGSDFRAIYNFYVDRRDAALFRERTNTPGPQHTLEEIYLKYRIIRE
ncbi:MAG: hypothetical protein FWD78_16930 [Treponema sp.]|nr:hypothetical protein [Treponema sp.]